MYNVSDDDDEGFVPNKIQIKHKQNKVNKVTAKKSIPNDIFQARYLFGDGVLWKQPSQSYQTFEQCSIYHINESNQKTKRSTTSTQSIDHPYELYVKSQLYDLIYCRKRGDPFKLEQDNLITNQISLKGLISPTEDTYRLLKPFQFTPPNINSSDALQFDSRFQSGNLYCAFKQISKNNYVLFLENDTNTLGYNQWFYFSIKNAQPGVLYHFEIVNFKKKHSIFKYGYKMAIFSLIKSQSGQTGWYRDGQNITYRDSPIMNPSKPQIKFYSLSFDLKFDNKNDYIMIAMNLPYSYSKMIKTLQSCQKRAVQNGISWQMKKVATSICGNNVPEITIKMPRQDKKQQKAQKNQQTEQMIVIMARQHSGETWSSYMMEGFLKQISEKNQDTKWLIENFTLKIYPMINVDGVIYGNFRCDLTGVDLNRRWKSPSNLLHPQIYQIKKAIKQASKTYKILCCYDLHGHSKDYNMFCYSCKQNLYTCRILPYLISKINPIFYFPSCTFGLSKYKLTTARATIFKAIKTQNVLTIQSSFYGWKNQNGIQHFQPKHLFEMARSILIGTIQFFDKKSNFKKNTQKQIKENIKEITKYQALNEEESGSDSEPQCDEIQFSVKVARLFPESFMSEAKHFVIQKKKTQKKVTVIQQKQDKNMTLPVKSEKIQPLIPQRKKTRPQKKIDLNNKSQHIPIRTERKRVISPKIKQTLPNNRQSLAQRYYETFKKSSSPEQIVPKQSKFLFRNRRKLISIALNRQIIKHQQNKRSIQLIQPDIKGLIQPAEKPIISKPSQRQQQVAKSTQLKQKFKKLLEDSKRKDKKKATQLDFLEESIYNQDQAGMISILLQNKRMIQLEKIKRQVQKSTGIVQRQGKIRHLGKEHQNVIDFKKFRENSRENHRFKHSNHHILGFGQTPTNWQNLL